MLFFPFEPDMSRVGRRRYPIKLSKIARRTLRHSKPDEAWKQNVLDVSKMESFWKRCSLVN